MAEPPKKKIKKSIQEENQFIRDREKRASQLQERFGTSIKSGREQATKEIAARDPKEIARKQFETNQARKELEIATEQAKENEGIGKLTTEEFLSQEKNEDEKLLSGSVSPVTASDLTTAIQIGAGAVGLGLGLLALKKTGASAAIAGGKAVITQTRHAHKIVSGSLIGQGSITTQRAFTGKPATTGIDKIFNVARPTAARFATNAKSMEMSANFLSKFVKNPFTIISLIGTYPFAGFIKEEAIQTLTIAADRSLAEGDIEAAKEAQEQVNEQIDYSALENLAFAIPFANVAKEVLDFIKAAKIANDNMERRIAIAEAKATGILETGAEKFKRENTEAKINT